MEIDVIAYVQGLMEDLQERSENMTEEEYRKEQEELAQKTVAICQGADHRAYLYNDYRSGWNFQQWFKNCEYENGFYYVLRDNGTASIVGAEQEFFKGKAVMEIPAEIGGAVVREIERHAFERAYMYFHDISEIVIPDTVETINDDAFLCALLYSENSKINLPNSVKYIGRFAFGECLQSLADESNVIHVPESVEYLGFGALGFWADFYNSKVDSSKNYHLDMPDSLVLMEEYCFSYPENEKFVFLNGEANYLFMDDVAAYYAKSEAKPAAVASLVGDANADGAIDVGDAVLLSRYCAEDTVITLTADGKLNADASGDGSITLDDVNEILRIVAKF
jgi:hypothetical protein